jgi:hypothetical protein
MVPSVLLNSHYQDELRPGCSHGDDSLAGRTLAEEKVRPRTNATQDDLPGKDAPAAILMAFLSTA